MSGDGGSGTKRACFKTTVNAPVRGKARHRSRVVSAGGRSFALSYKDPADRRLEAKLAALLQADRPPGAPLRGPLEVWVTGVSPVPSSWSRRKREKALQGEIAPQSRPDVSNMAKLVEDALNGVWWGDDRQIVSLHARKAYGEVEQWRLAVAYDPALQVAADAEPDGLE